MPQNEETFTLAKKYLQIKFINLYFQPKGKLIYW